MAPVQSLAWELPSAAGVAMKFLKMEKILKKKLACQLTE